MQLPVHLFIKNDNAEAITLSNTSPSIEHHQLSQWAQCIPVVWPLACFTWGGWGGGVVHALLHIKSFSAQKKKRTIL